ncbi:MAG TPA: AAA family ATPase [Roseovarius sp.]
MTLYEPTMILNRLRVEKDGHAAYDELFHNGVNIIRGDNSSGKSTILNFIFYALGGDLSDWSETAELCTRVYAEVSLNGSTATLCREVSTKSLQPMDIYGGTLEEALVAGKQMWMRYPYKRSTKESFSQALFRLLDIPEAVSEGSGNLTMNQILRLHYADQLSPTDSLFKFEGAWDTPTIRDAVGRLLCGANETRIYENQLEVRALNSQLDKVSSEMSAIFTAMGHTGENLTQEWVDLQKAELEIELEDLVSKIATVERRQLTGSDDEVTSDAQNRAYSSVQDALAKLNEKKAERDQISFSIIDLEQFASSAQQKITALQEASLVNESLGDVIFEACPVCLESVIPDSESACHLCKTPIDSERAKARLVALSNEVSMQLKQTEEAIQRRRERLKVVEEQLAAATVDWQKRARLLAEIQSRPTTTTQDELRELYVARGYLERQIVDQDRSSAIVKRVSELSQRKSSIEAKLSILKDQVKALEAAQAKRLSVAYTTISEEVKSLLRGDLKRQDSFVNPNSVSFDFGANRISVDDHSYFSASSRVVLKTSFFVAFLVAAAKHEFFRHLRICLIDTIEDKGMEQERSQNYQRMIVDRSESLTADHQIIFATAMIAPDLDDPAYTVGKNSTLAQPTLEFHHR